ncbi:MAG: DMT family transporter [Weeksellaceae bacterium]
MWQKNKARIALGMGIFLISIYPVLVKALGDLSVVSAFYRMFISAVCLLPVLFWKNMALPKGKLLLGSIFCGLLFGLDVYCWNLAIEASSATQGTLLTNLAPVFVGIFTFLFLPNKPKRNFWIGSAVAVLGMVTFIGWEVFADLSFDRGFILGISSAILYAVYILTSKVILEEVAVFPYMLINTATASIILGSVNYIHNEPFTGFSSNEWFILIIGGVFCQLFAWLLISYATKYMRATRVSLSLLSQTVFASLLASLILREYISLQAFIGGMIILVGVALTFIEKPFKLGLKQDFKKIK